MHMLTGSNGSAKLGAAQLGIDVVGDRVGLQKGEERLLDREVTGVAGDVDVVAAGRQAGGRVGPHEAALVGFQRRVADRGDIGREGDQVVEAAAAAVGVANLLGADLGRDLLDVGRRCRDRRTPR